MWLIRLLAPSMAMAIFLFSAAADGAATLLPLRQRPAETVGPETRLRGDHTLMLFAPQEGAPLALRVEAVQVGRYTTEVVVDVPGVPEARRVLRPEQAGGPGTVVVRFAAPERGVVRVDLSTHANAARVAALGPNAWLAVEASERQPVHVISRAGGLHFFVPRSAKSFAVLGRGGGGRENVRLSVYAPDGALMGRAAALGKAVAAATVSVPPEHRGKVWRLVADRPPEFDGVFEDAQVWLAGDVPTWVSPQPEGLVVPFCHGLTQPPRWRGGKAVDLAFALNVEPPGGAVLHGALSTAAGKTISEGRVAAAETLRLSVPPTVAEGTHGLRIRLVDAAGKELGLGTSEVRVSRSLVCVGEPQAMIRSEAIEREGRPPALRVSRNLLGDGPDLSLEVSLLRTSNAETPGRLGAERLLRREVGKLTGKAAQVAPPEKLPDGHYQWRAVARVGSGEVVDVQCAHFLLDDGDRFTETPPSTTPPMPVLSADDQRRGFVGFVPDAVDGIAYNSRPVREDLERRMHIQVARGEYEPATLGVWAARDVKGLHVETGQATRAGIRVDVRVARHWPQRVSWRTTTYRIIPEMLEPAHAFDLALGQVRQIWLTVHAEADAEPGIATVPIRIRDASGQVWATSLEVRVLPFALQRPKHVHWGLYPDSSRWKTYSDDQVRAELRDVAAHGITTLMVYPPYHSEARYENGKLAVDAAEFIKHMAMAKEAGLGPPWVMSLQALGSVVRSLVAGKSLGDPEFKKVYQAYAAHFAQLARQHGWGECVWHTIDEPWSEEKRQQAVAQLGYMKELGLPTFTTAGPVGEELDKVLDVRCYSIGHLLGSAGVLDEGTRATKASGDRLWYYGSGCYTGQDGNAIENRFITGFLFWRSGAEGEWTWTFLRPKGDAFDDFDGKTQREHKDACTVYPSPDNGAPMPTLQWEGIREGIDDYAYLHTLEQLAKQKGGEKGRAALDELTRIVADVPVRRRAGDFTAARAQQLRSRVIRAIVALAE